MTTTSIHSSHYDEAAPFSPHFITTTIPVVVVVVVFCLSADQSVWKTPFHPISAVDSQTHFSDPFSSNSQFCKNPEGDRDQRECLCHMS
jgi:hypothetical protein